MDKGDLNFQLYRLNDDVEVESLVKDESIWLTQKAMAELFGVDQSSISRHLKNIYETKELALDSTYAEIAYSEQKAIYDVQKFDAPIENKKTGYYNLDAIISVGYRVNTRQATQFRQWATKTLKEYMIKGFVLDDDRLKQGKEVFNQDYFQELLERVRSIRSSEKIIYKQLTDIFAEISFDYNKNSKIANDFYANIQNKLHYAITGKTGAEIIAERSDSNKEHMGLTSWKNSPNGRILKSDANIAKNYLSSKEIKELENNVSALFDDIEIRIQKNKKLSMADFSDRINKFLDFRDYDILEGFGTVSKSDAKSISDSNYDEFNKSQKIKSDFDELIEKTKNKQK